MNDRPTYPEILKFFYKHSFPDQLGAPGSAVAQAIIYKSNELWFPAEFVMSNKELSQLSGEKLSNIGRTRQKVLDTCIVDAQPLFVYVSGKERRAGKYMINFNLTSTQLQDNFNSASNRRQKQGKIDEDPNSTKQNKTKQIPPTPLNEVTTGNSKEVATDEEGGQWTAPADTEEDWIEYIVDALKKPGAKYPTIDIQEKAKWLVEHNDLVLLEECYEEFMQIPVVKIGSRTAFFMSMIENRGGEVIR